MKLSFDDELQLVPLTVITLNMLKRFMLSKTLVPTPLHMLPAMYEIRHCIERLRPLGIVYNAYGQPGNV